MLEEYLRAIRYAFGGDPDGEWRPDPAWLRQELTRLVEQDSTMGARTMEMQDLREERDVLQTKLEHLWEAFVVIMSDGGEDES